MSWTFRIMLTRERQQVTNYSSPPDTKGGAWSIEID